VIALCHKWRRFIGRLLQPVDTTGLTQHHYAEAVNPSAFVSPSSSGDDLHDLSATYDMPAEALANKLFTLGHHYDTKTNQFKSC
jgi:hypothetical protein